MLLHINRFTQLSKAINSEISISCEIPSYEALKSMLSSLPKHINLFLRAKASEVVPAINSLADSFPHVGFCCEDVHVADLDDSQLIADRSASNLVAIELCPPNLRCNVVESCQRRNLLVFCKVPASSDLRYLETSSAKYGISGLQLLTKALLQMGVIVVLPLQLLTSQPNISMLCHPFATRRLFSSATRVYRLLIERDDMEFLREQSWETEDNVYANGRWNPALLSAPSPRQLSLELRGTSTTLER